MYEEIRRKFEAYGQEHVFRFWHELTEKEKESFIEQLKSVDLDLITSLTKTHLNDNASQSIRDHQFLPPEMIPIPRSDEEKKRAKEAAKLGDSLLRAGKVGIILVAGGQGTRLGFPGPKGKFPISPVKNKSLFQLHAEKILALCRHYQVEIPWYIMTSAANDAETRSFFEENRYFGLNPDQVFFFRQNMIPAVDANGKFFLEEKGRLFTNPDGHGGTLKALRQSGALEDMARRGVEELFYFQVDNVLIQICDPVFLGYHAQAKAEMSSKVVAKRDPFEKVGVIGYLNGKLRVIEYSDMSAEEMTATNPDGSLKFNAGSIAIHMINRHFIGELTQKDFSLPYHVAFKKIPHINDAGEKVVPDKPNGYKFEMFIFDALQYTRNSVVMEVDRNREFSPVKNATGEDSPQTAQQDLCNYFGDWLEQAGCTVPREKETGNVLAKVEISPLFARNPEELRQKVTPNLSLNDQLYLGD